MAKQTHVSASFQQDFLPGEQEQARLNIGAASTAVATQSTDGLMSAADKVKLDTMASPASKYWMWNPSGNPSQGDWNDSTWTTITYISSMPNLIPNMANANNRHVITNFTEGSPEAFKTATDSARVLLKKGLWHYSMLIEVELVTAGSGFTNLAVWAQEQDPNNEYTFVRPSYFPTTNSIITKYTRQVDGDLYVPIDPVYSNGSWRGYSLKFMLDWDQTDAELRCRQSSFSLTRTSW